MLIAQPLPFIKAFIEDLNDSLKQIDANAGLSGSQKGWLAFCCLGILVTNSVCWAKFERSSLAGYKLPALSWMFRCSKICWELLLHGGVKAVLKKYDIGQGIIVIDDSCKKRSKSSKDIFRIHKFKDNSSGGYIMGQSIVLSVLVTDLVTIPVGFGFYEPDPELSKWYKMRKEIAKGSGKHGRLPKKPRRSEAYPTKQRIALTLLKEFSLYHHQVYVKCIVADALYGTNEFINEASMIFEGIQVICQFRSNQNVRSRNNSMHVKFYFAKYGAGLQEFTIRGGKTVKAMVGSARLYVPCHKKKRFVIALKYEGEEEYRYLMASDLSWRTLDILQAYSLRWLIEVFFEDWKSYEGWGQLTKHTGEDGSSRSLILSLLLDHCLLLHPDQISRIENNLPASTTGSLIEKVKADNLLQFIQQLLKADDPQQHLEVITEVMQGVFRLKPSKKHMVSRDLGRLEPTSTLKKYRVEQQGLAA